MKLKLTDKCHTPRNDSRSTRMSNTPMLSSRYSRSISPWNSTIRGMITEQLSPAMSATPIVFNLPPISRSPVHNTRPEIRTEVISRNEVGSQESIMPLVPLNTRRQTMKSSKFDRNYQKKAILSIIPMEDFELESWRRVRTRKDYSVNTGAIKIIYT